MNMLRKRYGFFNVTVIDAEGKPTTTQLYTSDPTLPVEWIVNRVQNFGSGRRDSVVAAYLFDTNARQLRMFDVLDGRLLEKTEGVQYAAD